MASDSWLVATNLAFPKIPRVQNSEESNFRGIIIPIVQNSPTNHKIIGILYEGSVFCGNIARVYAYM